MELFTSSEFESKYGQTIDTFQIESASEMIFAQIGATMRGEWNSENVPERVKAAAMEQARFLIMYEIPHIDTHKLKAGAMDSELITEYSTLALTMLANAGFMYRGNPINYNMSLGIEFGGE